MQKPLEITFRGIPKSDEIIALINKKVAKLEKICNYIISCSVAVEKPQHFQRIGNPYRVRITLRVPPGHEIVTKRESTEGDMHDPLQKVLRSAFDAAGRSLQALVKKQRGETKSHPANVTAGIVARVFPEEGYGFLRTIDDNSEIYFHRNSVLSNHFEKLRVGTGVRFHVEMGEKGLQASTVEVVDTVGAPFQASLRSPA